MAVARGRRPSCIFLIFQVLVFFVLGCCFFVYFCEERNYYSYYETYDEGWEDFVYVEDAAVEVVPYNVCISDFYADMARWSFNLQVYFLNKRFKDVVEIDKSDKYIIQDRTIYEDARIFAPNLHEQGFMSDRDFDTFQDQSPRAR